MREKRSRLHLLLQPADVTILDAQSPLGMHDAALALDHFRLEREIAQPIGLHFEHGFERRARQPVLIHRHVVGSECVVTRAVRFEHAIELALRPRGRAVEHHVLEEVREAGDARHFVAAAGVHPVEQRDVRDVAIRPDDDLHAIRERDGLHLIGAGYLCRRAGARQRCGEQRATEQSARHTAPSQG